MKTSSISAALYQVDDKVHFLGTARDNNTVSIDYPPPLGTGDGYNPMELFLLSLGSCTATTLVTLMRDRMRRTVDGLSMTLSGNIRSTHPKIFETIHVRITLYSPDATEAEVVRAMSSAEKKLCPIWSMIQGNVHVENQVLIEREKPE